MTMAWTVDDIKTAERLYDLGVRDITTNSLTPRLPRNNKSNNIFQRIIRWFRELFAAIGEPESSQYASSCEVDGGEDGMQFYDGFYVWTLRTDEEELVRAVYLDE